MDEIRKLLEDISTHGLRFDLNPTVNFSWNLEETFIFFHNYIREMDGSIRQRAKEALALLPSEGETRDCQECDEIKKWRRSEDALRVMAEIQRDMFSEALRKIVARCESAMAQKTKHGYALALKSCFDRARHVLQADPAKPAPSSEKAIREALLLADDNYCEGSNCDRLESISAILRTIRQPVVNPYLATKCNTCRHVRLVCGNHASNAGTCYERAPSESPQSIRSLDGNCVKGYQRKCRDCLSNWVCESAYLEPESPQSAPEDQIEAEGDREGLGRLGEEMAD